MNTKDRIAFIETLILLGFVKVPDEPKFIWDRGEPGVGVIEVKHDIREGQKEYVYTLTYYTYEKSPKRVPVEMTGLPNDLLNSLARSIIASQRLLGAS